MKIGITYDLRTDYIKMGFSDEETAEFDREDTIEAIETTLHTLGYETQKIGNIYHLINALGREERWDLVFNICEGLYGISRESQVPSILDAFQIPYTFSNAMILSIAMHKGLCKQMIRQLKIPTAPYLVLANMDQLKNVKIPYPLFAKPVAEGTSKGITAHSKINDFSELKTVCQELFNNFKQPILIEKYLPGREFTVGIVGNGENAKAIACMEIIIKDKKNKEIYTYEAKEKCEEQVLYQLANDDMAKRAIKTALKAYIGLGCQDTGRVDLKVDEKGIVNFIEINPIPGLHPAHSDLPMMAAFNGISYSTLLKMIVDAALERTKKE
jgi:D-alanine-D-alanine ligase